jgi:hypothetical protein
MRQQEFPRPSLLMSQAPVTVSSAVHHLLSDDDQAGPNFYSKEEKMGMPDVCHPPQDGTRQKSLRGVLLFVLGDQ